MHGVHALNSEVKQCIGHGPLVHCWVSLFGPHVPPPLAGWTTLRERLRDPVPHVLLHGDQSLKVLWTHGTTHTGPVHTAVSSPDGQLGAPQVACTIVRVRVLRPDPQVTLHAPHAAHW